MSTETFERWRDRLLDLAAIYGHTACREGMALASEGDDFRAAGKVREDAWAKLLEAAFNPPASVDPHVRAAVERKALDARNDRYREAKQTGFSDADARLHSEQVLDFFRRSHG